MTKKREGGEFLSSREIGGAAFQNGGSGRKAGRDARADSIEVMGLRGLSVEFYVPELFSGKIENPLLNSSTSHLNSKFPFPFKGIGKSWSHLS